MVRGRTLITPPVSENVLEGITRASVMELAQRELGLQVKERPIDRSELYICDELFLTGTAVGISAVVRVDHRPVKHGEIGAWTQQLQQFYADAARGHLPAYRKWLVPVYETSQETALSAVHLAETTVA
jgi:branched-chain amino acid aminotransferase